MNIKFELASVFFLYSYSFVYLLCTSGFIHPSDMHHHVEHLAMPKMENKTIMEL